LRLLYSLLLYFLIPYVIVRLIYRGFSNHGYWHRWHERFGFVSYRQDKPVIWVHAVSVGETRAAAPLINELIKRYPDHRVWVTTMTPTGSDQVQSLFGDRVEHSYVPYDLPFSVSLFLNRIKPATVLIMETELWPNIYHGCFKRGIPVCLANVRISASSFKGYQMVQGLTKNTLAKVSRFAVQSDADAARIMLLGASQEHLQVTGNIKFDLQVPASVVEAGSLLRQRWGKDRSILLAASTHEGEETIILSSFKRLKKIFPELLLVLVPRHPERFSQVARLVDKKGFQSEARSSGESSLPANVDILVGDTMGELQLFFAAADIAIICGSFVPVGGHNLLEAAAVGAPSVFGPYMENFIEISEISLDRGAGFQAVQIEYLDEVLEGLLKDPNKRYEAGEAAKKMIAENRGALERTLEYFSEKLPALPITLSN